MKGLEKCVIAAVLQYIFAYYVSNIRQGSMDTSTGYTETTIQLLPDTHPSNQPLKLFRLFVYNFFHALQPHLNVCPTIGSSFVCSCGRSRPGGDRM